MLVIKLVGMTLLPVILSFFLHLLKKKTSFGNFAHSDIVAGVVFGAAAVICTEFGVDTGLAIYNTRDASVICAGLFFGWRASALAAVIGSVERFLAPLWGVGVYTRWACSIATACAGIFTSLIVKYLFNEENQPSPTQGFSMGAFIEVFHMLMVFVTHANDIHKAFEVVRQCSLLMILMNATAVALAILCIDFSNGKKQIYGDTEKLSFKFGYGLAIAMCIGFAMSISFISILQKRISDTDARTLLASNIEDVKQEILATNKTSLFDMRNSATYRHIGTSGYLVITDVSGNLITGSKEYIGRNASDFGISISSATRSEMQRASIGGVDSYYIHDVLNGFNIVAVLPVDEAKFSNRISVYVSIFMELLVFAILFIMLNALERTLILKNVDKVNKGLKSITSGDLSVKLDVNGNKEFKSISESINSTVDKLEQLIDEANARMDEELLLAKRIQQDSLPCVFPPFPNRQDVDVYATMQTAKQVGGDFYDFFFASKNKLYIVIADVSGKGIPAALFMMKSKTIIRNLAETEADLSEVVSKANNELCENNEMGMFVTSWVGCLDTDTGILTYCNAGHNPPAYVSKNRVDMLRRVSGLVLAGLPGVKYKSQTLKLEKGDKIFLYTDGVTEAVNSRVEMYTEDRLLDLLSDKECHDLSAKELCIRVKESVEKFSENQEQFDDITMLCMEYK